MPPEFHSFYFSFIHIFKKNQTIVELHRNTVFVEHCKNEVFFNVPFVPFQQACGFEYTSKLQRMFQDIGVSKDLNDKFKAHLANTGPLDCKYHTSSPPHSPTHTSFSAHFLFLVMLMFNSLWFSGFQHSSTKLRVLAISTVCTVFFTSRGTIITLIKEEYQDKVIQLTCCSFRWKRVINASRHFTVVNTVVVNCIGCITNQR